MGTSPEPRARYWSAHERISRADHHWTELQNGWKAAVENGAYRVRFDVQDDGAATAFVEPVHRLPATLSLELGEMLYQLRAALNACVYEAPEPTWLGVSSADEKTLEFPICATASEWKNAARKIKPLSNRQKRFIESVQPYNIAERPGMARVVRSLGILNEWARKDRHRRLHIMGATIRAVVEPRLPNGAAVRISSVMYEPVHFVERDPVVARFKIEDWTPGSELHADQRLMAEIGVDEEPPLVDDTDTLSARAQAMFYAVKLVLEEFEETSP